MKYDTIKTNRYPYKVYFRTERNKNTFVISWKYYGTIKRALIGSKEATPMNTAVLRGLYRYTMKRIYAFLIIAFTIIPEAIFFFLVCFHNEILSALRFYPKLEATYQKWYRNESINSGGVALRCRTLVTFERDSNREIHIRANSLGW